MVKIKDVINPIKQENVKAGDILKIMVYGEFRGYRYITKINNHPNSYYSVFMLEDGDQSIRKDTLKEIEEYFSTNGYSYQIVKSITINTD